MHSTHTWVVLHLIKATQTILNYLLDKKDVSVALSLRLELLEDFPADIILDKSKASPFAKADACFQAVWFCLQCLKRMIRLAPISLLELGRLQGPVFVSLPDSI